MYVNEKIFEKSLLEFNKIANGFSNDRNSDFKNHPLLEKHENYKYDIKDDAKNQLLTNTWKETDLGTGRILECVKNAINLNSNNLIDWRKKDDFKKLKANRENEKLLFDFFKTKIEDENAFNQFYEIGFSYQLIAYLFFIKNYQKYMPISQEQFDKIFSSLEIDFKTSHNCSWENYLEYNELIKQFRKYLSRKTESRKQEEIEPSEEKPKPELEIYQPKKVIDLESLTNSEEEIDYIENHRKLMEIGELAEKIVFESEIEFLKADFPELAEKVRIVSNNPKLGFDILSFETDGNQKQIEVKAISVNKNNKSFIISRNEFSKSKIYSNYYVYCVKEVSSENPKILRIKNPDFENNNEFIIEPLTYKITFE